ncbi:MAG: protein translocase subunit SecD [Clostridiaceae bacterium]|nr:protein translocase subunit SecD [Clostridiaceae bacterium]
MDNKRKTRLFMVILVVMIICVLSITGLGPENARIVKGVNELRTGIDIRGGISAVMEPVYPNGSQGRNVAEDLSSARRIIEARLDAQGIFDKTINVDATNNRLVIDIPWAQNEKEFDPRKALDELGSTGALTFQEVNDEDMYKDDSQLVPSGKIIMTGDDIETAKHAQYEGAYIIILQLKDSGVEKFSEATGRLIGKRIAIFMDDICLSAPVVNDRINTKEATITGNFTLESAKTLADKIRFGALPTKLEAVKVDSISAQLGQGALEIAVKAGILSFILVCLFMILYYRLPGVISVIALSGLVALQILVLSNFNISVTLPGIGGIILAIGMSVDGNVIIFERIKEELKEGKSLRAAIDSGFKRAFVAILDSNVTTIITAVVLYVLGSGPVRGFGITLLFGTIFSFLSANTATRIMLQGVVSLKVFKNKRL